MQIVGNALFAWPGIEMQLENAAIVTDYFSRKFLWQNIPISFILSLTVVYAKQAWVELSQTEFSLD